MVGPKEERHLIRNSSNHDERWAQVRTRIKEFEQDKEKFLEEKGIDEKELRWIMRTSPGPVPVDYEETYIVCYSMTGTEIKRCMYQGGFGDVFEEERMVDIAENIAMTLKVDVNDIALTKPPESIKKKENGHMECRLLVTLQQRQPVSRSRSRSRSSRSIEDGPPFYKLPRLY